MHLKRLSIVAMSSVVLSASMAMTAFADTTIIRNVSGSVIDSSTEQQIGDTSSQTTDAAAVENPDNIPSVVKDVVIPENLDLDSIVANAGLGAVGFGNTPTDPIVGDVQMIHYGLWNTANQEISGSESNLDTYAYSKDGFQKLYLNHSGIGRYYYRTYNLKSGWSTWMNSTQTAPITDPEDRVQAVQIRVKGYTGVRSDLYYKAVLNDGTVLDWAKNGQTMGTIGTDRYIVAIKLALWNKEIPFTEPTKVLMEASAYEGTYSDRDGQVQYSSAAPYTGWGFYNNDQYYFVEGVKQKGWQYIDGYKYYLDENTGAVVRDLEPVMGLQSSYVIRYNKSTMTMYIMASDGDNGYIIPYKTFMSTDGNATPVGNFKTYAKYRWKIMHDDIYCQFLSRFKDGYIIHSLIYRGKGDPNRLDTSSYNYMDDARSDGCLRLRAGDAAWVYHNTNMGTPVIVYEDPTNKGPVEKDAIDMPIPVTQTYDPTDPVMQGK